MSGPTNVAAPARSGVRRAPELSGVFPAPVGTPFQAAAEAEAVTEPPAAAVTATGHWRPGELRIFRRAACAVVAVGQCLAPDGEFEREAARALATGRFEPLTRWPGSYLCLVVRPTDLTVFVDLAEQYPFFYRHDGGRTFLGTRPAAVAGAARRPDLMALAAQILLPGLPALTGDRSPVAGVSRLGAGQAMRITAAGAVTRWTYEPLRPDGRWSAAEGAAALATALDRSVALRAERTGGRLTADFSGGLDSTSLAFLALPHLPGKLTVFTYRRAGSTCDDSEYATRFAQLDARLDPFEVTGDAFTLTYRDLDGAAPGDEPDAAAVASARTRLRLARIARLGGGVHLGGEGGDALLTAPSGYLADLVRPGSLRRLVRDGRALARTRHAAPTAVVANALRLSRTSAATALRRTADLVERGGGGAEPGWLDTIAWWPAPGAECGWFTPSARRELAELARAAAATETGGGLSAADRVARCELRASAAAQRRLDAVAREFGVWPQAPFLDSDVVRACLTLPAHRRAAPPGFKPLLRLALHERVPAPVLARRTKGDYTDEDYLGARAAAGSLRALLRDSRLADLGVIEPDAVAASLDRALMGLGAPLPALNRLVGAELWLRRTSWH